MGWVDSGLAGAGGGSALGPWGAAAGFLVGAGGALIGAGQKKKGNDLLAHNPYPYQPIPQEVLDNQTKANAMAERGLPSEQYQNAMKNIQRSSNNAIKMSADRRGGLALIPTIQQGATDATLNLDTADAKQKIQNQKTAYDVNNQVAGWKQRQFDWNAKNKYQQDYNMAQQLIGAGNANQGNAFDTILSTAALFGNSGGFGRRKTNGVTQAPVSTSPIGTGNRYVSPNYIF